MVYKAEPLASFVLRGHKYNIVFQMTGTSQGNLSKIGQKPQNSHSTLHIYMYSFDLLYFSKHYLYLKMIQDV